MYEFVTESAVNELGNMGEHEWAEEIDRRAIRASLQCRRVWDVHYKLYDILSVSYTHLTLPTIA